MSTIVVYSLAGFGGFLLLLILGKSLHKIGPTEVGLVAKRFAVRKLSEDNPIAFRGEAGYQSDLLMPGLRFKFWPIFGVTKHPWVQIPAGEIGVVIAQVGSPLPIGAKSAVFKPEFANFSNLRKFIAAGGQKGVQRPVLPPGTLVPIHPVGFMVLTRSAVFGVPVSPELQARADRDGTLSPQSFGLRPEQLAVTVIAPAGEQDVLGVVTALEGDPLPSGDIASRLGGYADVSTMEQAGATDQEVIETLLGNKNNLHNNYQDFQQFLEHGGRIGLQHDPLLYGAYLLNPFLIQVEKVPMLVVEQGEVAVIKSYVGLTAADTSGEEFKFGSLVRPGHRGIWQEPLRTGKYPINPRVYAAEIVPTAILTLNWAEVDSQAHDLDANLKPIDAKSREGFVFSIDLQVQIHVPDTKAPKVISMVGTMFNLVNEVLQSAVGNHFRDKLQGLPAITFIETRQSVQEQALTHIKSYLSMYEVETKGVYIQDVILPEALVQVLTSREIANQEKATYQEQQRAETARVEMEKAKGTANMQAQLAQSQVGVDIKRNEAAAREAEATGQAAFVRLTGEAEASKVQAVGLAEAKAVEALGLARARGFEEQKKALGQAATALVNAINAISEGKVQIVPEVLVTGSGGSIEGLAATLMRSLNNGDGIMPKLPSPAPASTPEPATSSSPSPQPSPAPPASRGKGAKQPPA
jgi:regulator of protease activity HflC (stomatin/prohibitin superfamily)